MSLIMTQIIRWIEKEMKISLGGAVFIGRGFGGFTSISSLLNSHNFHLPLDGAVAIAPIADWRAHSKCDVTTASQIHSGDVTASIPTERMFGLLKNNLRKYQLNNLLSNQLSNLQKKILIFHGLLDSKMDR